MASATDIADNEVRRRLLNHIMKCRLYIRAGMHLADARLELRRAQQMLGRMRKRRAARRRPMEIVGS